MQRAYSVMRNHSYTAKSKIVVDGNNTWNYYKEIFFYKNFLVDSRFSLLVDLEALVSSGTLWLAGEDNRHLVKDLENIQTLLRFPLIFPQSLILPYSKRVLIIFACTKKLSLCYMLHSAKLSD